MVQVIETGNPQGKLSEMLGMSLGQGIGNGLNTFFANRSLESVLQDKTLEGAPQSKKLEALRSALTPYGEKGQELFNQRLQIDQLEKQELDTQKQEALQKRKGKALGKYLRGEELTEEEDTLFTPQEFVSMYKAKNPKAPPVAATNQPIPTEQVSAIENYMSEYPDSTSDQLAIGLAKAGVNPIYSNPYIENRRRQEENQSRQKASDVKIANKNDIQFHQESKEYADKIRNEAKIAQQKLETIKPIIEDVKSGKINPTSKANIFRFFGPTGNKIADALLTGKEANLLAAVPEFLEGRKELFGVRLSDADLKILQDKLPDISKSPQANLTILNLMKKYAERSILRQQAAESVIEEKGLQSQSGKLRPLNYENLVEHKFEELQNEEESGVMMRFPDGKEVPIERSKVKEAETLHGGVRLKKQ